MPNQSDPPHDADAERLLKMRLQRRKSHPESTMVERWKRLNHSTSAADIAARRLTELRDSELSGTPQD